MRILVDGQTLETAEANRGIGVYFKNVLNSMMKNDAFSEWYIIVSDEFSLQQLDPWVKERIKPIVSNDFNPSILGTEGFTFQRKYTDKLIEIIKNKQIDVFWSPNVLMNNVLFIEKKLPCKMVVTIHDLIPIVLDEVYLKNWPDFLVDEYKSRLNKIGQWIDEIIFDSESAQKDFNKFVQANNKQNIVYLGVSKSFSPESFKFENNEEPFILYTGGFDYRKNMECALKAFANLVNNSENDYIKNKLKLVIVCAYSEEAKEEFLNFAGQLDVKDKIILTGYISDNDLQNLYKKCSVFFFPSLYEGFGLPILEAMASGVPVVTSNISSLPEVGGDLVYYCNPTDIKDMSNKLHIALEETKKNTKRVEKGILHAKDFTWERTSKKTLEILTGTCSLIEQIIKKTKLAYVSPLSPQKTGIANFSRLLLPWLTKYFDIDVFVDKEVLKHGTKIEGVKNMYYIDELKEKHQNYKNIIYHLGNNVEFHKKIYDLALEIPGIVEVHDYNIHPFLQHAYWFNGRTEIYRNAFEQGYGEEGLKHYKEIEEGKIEADIWKFPMSHAIVKKSKAAIVHSHWVREQLPNNLPIYVIPHFATKIEKRIDDSKINKFNKKYGILNREQVITCFGYVNPNKRPEVLIKSVERLINKGYPIKLVFAGALNATKITKLINELNIAHRVVITGYLSREEYLSALEITDIVVNLRYPTMGESSGTLCEALSAGKATIVSNISQYKEFPDDVCWKVDVNDYEGNLLEAYLETLLRDKEVRYRLGENGRQYAQNVIGIKGVAHEYWRVIEKT